MAVRDHIAILDELTERISSGQGWYEAMLRAVREWPLAEEEIDGEKYVYLLDGEALDLLRLCERLYLSVAEMVPGDEFMALIANDRPPGEQGRKDIRSLVGQEKYRAYLNFVYGVLVEELVVHAVLEELRKRKRVSGLTHYDASLDEAYRYVYGATVGDLIGEFRREKGLSPRRSMTLTEKKGFTYWLFKTRLRTSDKSRVASDTKRALTVLHRYVESRRRLER